MSFTEQNLVPNAGLLPAAVLAQRIGVGELIDEPLRLAAHGVNSGAKALTVIGSMLAGGDSIDDTGLLRAGAAGEVVRRDPGAPSTIGSWLRAHKWSNVRELDAISRELLARLWAAGAGPVDLAGPLTIDLDSSIVPVYGRRRTTSLAVSTSSVEANAVKRVSTARRPLGQWQRGRHRSTFRRPSPAFAVLRERRPLEGHLEAMSADILLTTQRKGPLPDLPERGPDLRFNVVAGAGFEPATSGL